MLLKYLVKGPRLLAAGILLTLFSPYYLEVYMGNASFLTGVLLLAVVLLERRGRSLAAAVLLTVSIIIKPVGLVLLPWLLMRRRWRTVALVVLVVTASAIPTFLTNRPALREFVRINFDAVPAAGWVVHAGNQGLHCLFVDICTRVAGIPTGKLASFRELPGPCPLLITCLPLLLVAVSAAASWRGRERTFACAFLWLTTYLLGYKDVWEHSYSFVVAPLLCLYLAEVLPGRFVLVAAAWMALPTAFAIYDVPLPPGPFDPEHHWSTAVSLLHHATKPLGLLIPYLLVARHLWKGNVRGDTCPSA